MKTSIDRTLAEIMVSREEIGKEKITLKLIDKALQEAKQMVFKLTRRKIKT